MGFLALLAGLVGLWIGTEMTILGAIVMATRLNLSEFVVGSGLAKIGCVVGVTGLLANLAVSKEIIYQDEVVGCLYL